MPVIINEFEVLDESSQGIRSDTAATQGENETLNQAKALPIVPHTIIRILRHQKERLARVRAH
jgi:hypothetical protein